MYPALCAEVDAPYGQPGAMVLAFTEEERANIQTLYEQGVANILAYGTREMLRRRGEAQ